MSTSSTNYSPLPSRISADQQLHKKLLCRVASAHRQDSMLHLQRKAACPFGTVSTAAAAACWLLTIICSLPPHIHDLPCLGKELPDVLLRCPEGQVAHIQRLAVVPNNIWVAQAGRSILDLQHRASSEVWLLAGATAAGHHQGCPFWMQLGHFVLTLAPAVVQYGGPARLHDATQAVCHDVPGKGLGLPTAGTMLRAQQQKRAASCQRRR